MSDLAKELLQAIDGNVPMRIAILMDKAADVIECLRAENASLSALSEETAIPHEALKAKIRREALEEVSSDWGMLGVAICLVAEAHEGQTDKAGRPYLEHAIRVMHRCPFDPVIKTVGVLHDVIEDCEKYSLERFRERGFSDTVCEALDAVTHRKGEPYMDYVRRAGANQIARAVKLADLEDNSDPKRLAALSPEDAERLLAKYEVARAILSLQPEGSADA
jgi:hypothetical protein